jgi:cyclic lactone autoinducer peptide
MFKASKLRLLQVASVFLLFIAAGGIKPACATFWYQPKLPE